MMWCLSKDIVKPSVNIKSWKRATRSTNKDYQNLGNNSDSHTYVIPTKGGQYTRGPYCNQKDPYFHYIVVTKDINSPHKEER